MKKLVALLLLTAACGPRSTAPSPTYARDLVDNYLESYFETFPSRATAAGRHDFDAQLENLNAERRSEWLELNRSTSEISAKLLADQVLDQEDHFDIELLKRQADRVVLDYATLERPLHAPLYWSGMLSNATVMLLVRDDVPLTERLASAAARAALLPRLAGQARAALEAGDPGRIAPEHCSMAARQVAASARYYSSGFALAAGDDETMKEELTQAGGIASPALEEFSSFLQELAEKATGSPRLGDKYEERFRVVTGIEEPIDSLLEQAHAALEAKRAEAAGFARSIWAEVFEGEEMPSDDTALVRRMFERTGEDRATDVESFVAHYRQLLEESTAFVREHDIVTLPEPLTVHTDRSPSYFLGQSVGGVYPAGPYASPEAETLFFLPTPSDSSTAEQRDAFFRDFNNHFNTMITPHEMIPGHYMQLKYAAQHPRKIRALFGDGVYIEGWGTFCERLMLDLGWGGPLDRAAHLKKQMENIARTIVDIRVHTDNMSREEVLDFVQNEALQDQQFAGNMWRRAITSSPQLTYYYQGYDQVHGLYEDVKAARGAEFHLKEFMDGMMSMGPVAVKHYRAEMLPAQ